MATHCINFSSNFFNRMADDNIQQKTDEHREEGSERTPAAAAAGLAATHGAWTSKRTAKKTTEICDKTNLESARKNVIWRCRINRTS